MATRRAFARRGRYHRRGKDGRPALNSGAVLSSRPAWRCNVGSACRLCNNTIRNPGYGPNRVKPLILIDFNHLGYLLVVISVVPDSLPVTISEAPEPGALDHYIRTGRRQLFPLVVQHML